MSGNKKYYYLKLKDDFFDSEEIKVLESMDNGYKYSNILLKLLCRSDYYNRGKRFLQINVKLVSIGHYVGAICNVSTEDAKSAVKALGYLKLLKVDGDKLLFKDPGVDVERNRSTKQYKDWRKKVFNRDHYTCKHCNSRGVRLNAHHIKPWAKYKKKRFDINNGLTLCVKCHKEVHRVNGY